MVHYFSQVKRLMTTGGFGEDQQRLLLSLLLLLLLLQLLLLLLLLLLLSQRSSYCETNSYESFYNGSFSVSGRYVVESITSV